MRLTLHTDYALRVLIFVGVKGSGLSTIGEIAGGYGISKEHLRKVVHRLSQLGYLRTLQGRHGGIELGRPPDRINIGTVVREVEDGFALVECLDHGPCRCCIMPACVLRIVLRQALENFFTTLDGIRLSDLIRSPAPLVELLRIKAAPIAKPTPTGQPEPIG